MRSGMQDGMLLPVSTQIAVRLPDELVAQVDALVEEGRFRTKAEAIRAAIEGLVEAEARRSTGHRIAEGYRRVPQDDGEVAEATRAAIASIDEEPW